MKLTKILALVLALAFLCGCTAGQSNGTTPSASTPSNTLGEGMILPEDSMIVSYKGLRDENSGVILFHADILGDVYIEDGKISQDDGKGATIVTTVTDVSEGTTGADLMEDVIDRNKNVLAEFGESDLYFFETSDDDVNVCNFGIIKGEKLVSFEMKFPTESRATYFEIVSMLIQFYSQETAE